MSSKRQQCELEPCSDDRAAKQLKQLNDKKKHLYLIVDDWERGYSVYKIDVDSFSSSSSSSSAAAVPLPDPSVVRFEARHGRSWSFASHGSKILAMHPSPYPAFPVFDVHTSSLAVCPWPRPGGNTVPFKPLFFPSVPDGTLYLLRGAMLDALTAAAPPPDSTILSEEKPEAGWAWTPVVGSPPPFENTARICSTALHCDGRTLFVTHDWHTYSFDTESREWAAHGRWMLPFRGEAFFDAELDAWVGLCRHEGGVGYLCCCDVAPVAAEIRNLPAWKLGEDRLFDAGCRRHLGATLLCMGGGGGGGRRYCLVESLARDDEEDLRRLHCDGYFPHRRVLAVTTFGVKFDGQGQLVVTWRKVRAYETGDDHKLPDPSWKPVAFGM